MLVKLDSWLCRSFHWNHLKCPEILNSVEVGKGTPNINRYLLSSHAESVLKFFEHFNSLRV